MINNLNYAKEPQSLPVSGLDVNAARKDPLDYVITHSLLGFTLSESGSEFAMQITRIEAFDIMALQMRALDKEKM